MQHTQFNHQFIHQFNLILHPHAPPQPSLNALLNQGMSLADAKILRKSVLSALLPYTLTPFWYNVMYVQRDSTRNAALAQILRLEIFNGSVKSFSRIA